MHDGCSGKFENGKQVVEKLRMMGFNEQLMPIPAHIIFSTSKAWQGVTA